MHNEMLQVEGKKMSKSLGNFFTVRDLLDQGIPGEVIRFVFLSTHYRKPMDWTAEKARDAQNTLSNWRAELTGVQPSQPSPEVLKALASDLNSSKAIYQLRVLFSGWMQARTHGTNFGLDAAESEAKFLASANLMGLLEEHMGEWAKASYDFGVLENVLGGLRDEAIRSRDFSKLDALKEQLIDAGVEVRMNKDGVELRATPSLDTSKLVDLER
jgi:cysteinyl-tRNA synthetase